LVFWIQKSTLFYFLSTIFKAVPTLSNGTWSENKGRQLSRDNKTDCGGEKDKLKVFLFLQITSGFVPPVIV